MPPDPDRLRAVVEHLQAIDRPPASAGERRAAEWLRQRFAAHGLAARVEEERATGSFAIPIALLSAVGAAAGLSRRARPLAGAAGLAAAAAIADDVSAGPHVFRRLLPRRTTCNVVAEAGDPEGAETVVFVAHHDAANGGAVFHPGLTRWIADRFPDWYAGQETSPPLMRLVVAGPALAGLGALLGRRASAGSAAGWRSHRCSRSATSPRAPWCPAPTTTSPRSRSSSSSPGCWAPSRRRACACCCSRPGARSRLWRGCAGSSAATP